MSEIKMVALCGSPRKGGNTELLLEEFLKGAQGSGAIVEKFKLSDYCITPCRECLTCYRDGQCVIADDMQQIYPRLLEADLLVLASPIFFYGVTGWSKAMIDRCQALWARKYILHDPSLGKEGRRRRGFFISVGGTKGEKMFEGAILTVKYFYDAFNVKYAGELLFRGVDAKGDILKLPQALPEALAAGKKLVEEFQQEG